MIEPEFLWGLYPGIIELMHEGTLFFDDCQASALAEAGQFVVLFQILC